MILSSCGRGLNCPGRGCSQATGSTSATYAAKSRGHAGICCLPTAETVRSESTKPAVQLVISQFQIGADDVDAVDGGP